MNNTIKQDAYAVILPAFSELVLSDSVKHFLAKGGCSILVGETRDEYVSREMSNDRRNKESPDVVLKFNNHAASLSEKILIAVDQEIAGICRLHQLVTPFPALEELQVISASEFEALSLKMASTAKTLGFNCFLGPILDIVTGDNPWLKGRTWSKDPSRISEISSAFIRGIQSGGVAAAAKHFPGYSNIALDPAIDPDAIMNNNVALVETGYIPFEDAVQNNVEIIMTGPAIVKALDPDMPASLSCKVIQILKKKLKFQGVVLSDDLDSRATLKDRAIDSVAIDALKAGSDLLLIADKDDQIQKIANAIIDAVRGGILKEERLQEAAEKVRAVAAKYSRNE
jgi:beta-N-acetylhexosaminidase